MLLPMDPNFITAADRAAMTFEQIEAKAATQIHARVQGRELTKADLSAAFDLVKDEKHWKNPINCTLQLTADQVETIRDAVNFFAGCEATFRAPAQTVQWDNADRMVIVYHVTAPGYFRAVGA